jgi:hypothetical protein
MQLPDVPDSRMKFIEALKRAGKIPSSLFTHYEESCKKETRLLLEGAHELLTVYTPSRSLRSSADTILKVMHYNRKQHGARSFYCAAPPLWNALPHSLRHASSLTAFKHNLKTHLFSEYFG